MNAYKRSIAKRRGLNMNKERSEQAQYAYAQALERVQNTPEPKGQKFRIGSRVKIADNLGASMFHFPSGAFATVKYTYAHAYGGDDVKSYCLDVDGFGDTSWYREHQLTLIDDCGILDAEVIEEKE